MGEAVRIAANNGVVTVQTQTQATNGLSVKGGRGGSPSGGAQLRIVSDGGTLLHQPPVIYWGVGGVELSAFEHTWVGFSHFMRGSGAQNWSETARVSSNVWNFWSGIYTPSDSRLKDDVQDLHSDECLEVLRQVSAKSYVRTGLFETS